jgi:hypothetical protein
VQARDDVGPGGVGGRLVAVEALGGEQRPGAEADFGLEVPDEGRLPDPFFAHERDQARVAATGQVELSHEGAQFVLAGDEGVEVEARTRGVRVGLVGHHHAIAPVALGAIQGAVGGGEQSLDGLAVLRGAGHRDGDRDGDLLLGGVPPGAPQARTGVAQALGDLQRDLGGGGRQEDDKLVTAASPDQVARAQSALQHLGHRPQQIIALQPPVGRIDAREVVDVEEQQRDRLRVSLARAQEAGGALRPRGAVGDRGEGVVEERGLARLHARGERGGGGDPGDRDPIAHDLLEDLEDGGVELPPHVATHHVEGFVMREGRLERAA